MVKVEEISLGEKLRQHRGEIILAQYSLVGSFVSTPHLMCRRLEDVSGSFEGDGELALQFKGLHPMKFGKDYLFDLARVVDSKQSRVYQDQEAIIKWDEKHFILSSQKFNPEATRTFNLFLETYGIKLWEFCPSCKRHESVEYNSDFGYDRCLYCSWTPAELTEDFSRKNLK